MKRLISLALVFFALAACYKPQAPESFVDKEYILTNVPDNVRITLGFEGKDNRFFGKSAVNRYFGIYVLADNNLTLSPTGSTMMAGPQDLMEAEQNYLKELLKVRTFKLEGRQLKLYTKENKELVFNEMAPLDKDNAPDNNRYIRKAIENRRTK